MTQAGQAQEFSKAHHEKAPRTAKFEAVVMTDGFIGGEVDNALIQLSFLATVKSSTPSLLSKP